MNMARQEWPDRLKVFAKIDGVVKFYKRGRERRSYVAIEPVEAPAAE